MNHLWLSIDVIEIKKTIKEVKKMWSETVFKVFVFASILFLIVGLWVLIVFL